MKKFVFLVFIFSCLTHFIFSSSTDSKQKFGPQYTLVAKSEHPITSCAWSPDGKYFATTWGKNIVFWNSKTNEISDICYDYSGKVNKIKYSEDGNFILSISEDNSIIIRDTETYSEIIRINNNEEKTISDAAFSPDFLSVITSLDGNNIDLFFRLIMTKKFVISHLEGHSKPIFNLDTNIKNKYLLSTGSDGAIKLFELENNNKLATYAAFTDTKIPAIFLPDGKTFICAEKKDALVIQNVNGEKLFRIKDSDIPVNKIAISSDGNYFAFPVKNGGIKLYSLSEKKLLHYLDCEINDDADVGTILDLSFNNKGNQLIGCSSNGYLFKWNLNENNAKKNNFSSFKTDRDIEKFIKKARFGISEKNSESQNLNNQNSNQYSEQQKSEKEESEENSTQKAKETLPFPSSTLFLGTGYTLLPTDYYYGDFDFDICYQKNFNRIPLFIGLDVNLGGAVPNKNFPYKYFFEDKSPAKQPWIYTVKPTINFGYELYSGKNSRVFFNVFAGASLRMLWNNDIKNYVLSDLYKGIVAGLSGGADFRGITIKAILTYDTVLGIQPSCQLGYTIKFYKKQKRNSNK